VNVASGSPSDPPLRCVLCGVDVIATDAARANAADVPCRLCGCDVRRSAALFARLREGLARVLGVEPDLISPDTKLDDLGADSLDVVEYLMEIEDDFDVPDASSVRTIGDAIRRIER
jgi:acyl carrier protein